MTSESLRLRQLLARLVDSKIDFVLVGGLAVGAWGHVRATRDVDLVPDPAPSNLEKLDSVLRDLGGLGRVNVLQGLPQVPSFATLDRPRDRDDLEMLEGVGGDSPTGD